MPGVDPGMEMVGVIGTHTVVPGNIPFPWSHTVEDTLSTMASERIIRAGIRATMEILGAGSTILVALSRLAFQLLHLSPEPLTSMALEMMATAGIDTDPALDHHGTVGITVAVLQEASLVR